MTPNELAVLILDKYPNVYNVGCNHDSVFVMLESSLDLISILDFASSHGFKNAEKTSFLNKLTLVLKKHEITSE